MENLRYLLSKYNSSDSLFFGHRLTFNEAPKGYMSGGHYILSKKAVENLVEKILPKNKKCSKGRLQGNEDIQMGMKTQKTKIEKVYHFIDPCNQAFVCPTK